MTGTVNYTNVDDDLVGVDTILWADGDTLLWEDSIQISWQFGPSEGTVEWIATVNVTEAQDNSSAVGSTSISGTFSVTNNDDIDNISGMIELFASDLIGNSVVNIVEFVDNKNTIEISQNDINIEVDNTVNSVDVDNNPTEIILGTGNLTIETTQNNTTLDILNNQLDILSEGVQGPRGIPEEEVAFAKRVDFVSDTLIYRAEAIPGSNESDAVWRVRRLTLGLDDDVTEEWAGGVADFSYTWSDRASHTYS